MRAFDLYDVLTVLGLGLLAVGLWWLKPAAALIVVGGLIYLAGTRGDRSAKPRREG